LTPVSTSSAGAVLSGAAPAPLTSQIAGVGPGTGEIVVIELEAVVAESGEVPALWRLLELIDEDADGRIDLIRVELANGVLRDWRLRR
jgi:hypothetical protein